MGGSCGLLVATWALFSGRCRVHLRARHLVPDPRPLRDLLATAGADVTVAAVVLELAALGGRARLDPLDVHSLRPI